MSAIEKVLSDVISAATSHRQTGNTTALAMVAKENVLAVVIAANSREAHRIKQGFALEGRQVASIAALSRLRGGRSLLLFDPHAVAVLASGSLAEIDNLRSTLASLLVDHDEVCERLDRLEHDAAHLLAHQQARALEWRSVADADERIGIGVYRRQMGRAMDQRDATRAERDALRAESERLHRANVDLVAQASSREHERKQLRAENERKDAEIQRLKEVLRELVKWGRPFEGTAGHSLFDRWMERADDALGEEAGNA